MGKFVSTVADHLILPARVQQTRGQEQIFRLAEKPLPSPISVRLIIDTGSKRTTLVPGVVGPLQPATGGDVRVETSLAAGQATLFWVRFEFPGTSLEPMEEVLVARLNLPPSLSAFHGLIGRDLLRRWEYFHFEGRRGRFILRDSPGGFLHWLFRK